MTRMPNVPHQPDGPHRRRRRFNPWVVAAAWLALMALGLAITLLTTYQGHH